VAPEVPTPVRAPLTAADRGEVQRVGSQLIVRGLRSFAELHIFDRLDCEKRRAGAAPAQEPGSLPPLSSLLCPQWRTDRDIATWRDDAGRVPVTSVPATWLQPHPDRNQTPVPLIERDAGSVKKLRQGCADLRSG
jgi:hypothetical protein